MLEVITIPRNRGEPGTWVQKPIESPHHFSINNSQLVLRTSAGPLSAHEEGTKPTYDVVPEKRWIKIDKPMLA
jgi:hypothetical protein